MIHTDDVPKYLALTGGDAFKPRTEASRLLGFWLVETGGVLNRVVHFWEYDDLDHRSAVRAQLAGDEGFARLSNDECSTDESHCTAVDWMLIFFFTRAHYCFDRSTTSGRSARGCGSSRPCS